MQIYWASTPAAWTTEAMGRTMAAEMSPCTPPEITLEMATSQMGHGAWTRSSNLAGEAELLGQGHRHSLDPLEHDGQSHHTRHRATVAKADSAPGMLEAPMPWPILGKT